MINFKDWNMKRLGELVILSLVLILIIAVVNVFVYPLITTVMPTVFAGTLTLTDTLLFFILIRLVIK